MQKDELRDKLIELLKTNACPSPYMCDPTCVYYGCADCFPYRLADHIIAHGVTIQQWIPVTERLPEPMENPVLAVFMGTVFPAWYHGGKWEVPSGFFITNITHWMPLPQAPKEVE